MTTTETLAERIAARRKHIQDSAACRMCGVDRAFCLANRDPDPEIGCCSHCHHDLDPDALAQLLDEIESGHVRTVEEAAPKPRKPGMSWLDYLDQDEQWMPDGRPMVRVADMDPEWRFNASRWLERNAATIAFKYSLSERIWFAMVCASPIGPNDNSADAIERDMHDRDEARTADPVAWIRTTPLYRALVADLPKLFENIRFATEEVGESLVVWAGRGDCRCKELRAQDWAREEEERQ